MHTLTRCRLASVGSYGLRSEVTPQSGGELLHGSKNLARDNLNPRPKASSASLVKVYEGFVDGFMECMDLLGYRP